MKKFTLLTTATAIFMTFCTIAGISTVNADNGEQNYTKEDIVNLQDFLLAREMPDLSDKDYDLNNDGRWDVFDLCLMKREFLESSDLPENTGKTLVAYYSATGTTERIADYIAEEMNADIFVITPEEEYTSADLNWTNQDSVSLRNTMTLNATRSLSQQMYPIGGVMTMFSSAIRYGGRRLRGLLMIS